MLVLAQEGGSGLQSGVGTPEAGFTSKAFVLLSYQQRAQSTLANCTESRRALVQQACTAETTDLPQHTDRQV